jgi:hypothetical protein
MTLKFDHVSYVISLDHLARNFQRFGTYFSSPFVDGGIHPCFGTQYFKIRLQNGQYLEIVCPLSEPSINRKVIEKFVKVEIIRNKPSIKDWFNSELIVANGADTEVEWAVATASGRESGLKAVQVITRSGITQTE